jgi:hypothetical protein
MFYEVASSVLASAMGVFIQTVSLCLAAPMMPEIGLVMLLTGMAEQVPLWMY